MGREVRRVPPDWKHPVNAYGRPIPLFEGSRGGGAAAAIAEWDAEEAQWNDGSHPDKQPGGLADEDERELPFAEWHGERPDPASYMPMWSPEEATHLMMYETTSEGTPISPAFATPEELARWLADSGASAFGGTTASYEGWLAIARGDFAPGLVVSGGRMMSGVDFAAEHAKGG